MSNKTLDEIRKKLREMETRKGGNQDRSATSKLIYPHWNIPEGTSAILRFLPDANPDNVFFWQEYQKIKLTFPGIMGHDENKEITIEIPCIENWTGKNTCPILNEVRPMWKDPSMEEIARKYWIKRSYFAQGFVEQDPTNEEAPENPIRKFILTPQLFAIVKASLLDPDMDNSPVDYINGTNFVVSKTSKGGFSDYSTSKWARKESSLTTEQQDAIAKYGLVDLKSYLPKQPTQEQLDIQFEMFEASLAGELYDPSRWAKHYKPFGFDVAPSSGVEAPARTVQVPVTKPVATQEVVDVEDNDPPFEVEEKVSAPVEATATAGSGSTKSPQEILAMLRNRNKA